MTAPRAAASVPLLATALALAGAAGAGAQDVEPIRGFPTSLLDERIRLEERLRAVPSRDSIRERMRLLSAEPHEAGTPRSRRVARRILERFRAVGLDAEIERFEALMPRPVKRTLTLVEPEWYAARLEEPPVKGDPDSDDARQLPTYNAYAADGDVTAELVYVNYGIPEDYAVLDSLGVDVEGKIVVARYGRSWRGIKPKIAAERGAVGCILFSDPADDGFHRNDVYPEGPMRPWDGVQRGSVMDMPTYPGDPLTPGWGSVEGARKLPLDEARTLVSIPVLPVSYGDALPLLRPMEGPVAPEGWRGGLPITYHVGPGPAKARLALEFEWETRALYDVVARIEGERSPDQWLVYGNHHDAWVHGANDPIAGMAALEETARALGALLETGWRPDRTLVLAAWDGEEWGLLGSTEWAEHHAGELREKGVAYLGSDTNSDGWLRVAGSHSLERFIEEVARDIPDPHTGGTVLEAWLQNRRDRSGDGDAGCPCEEGEEDDADVRFEIGALGSGSDYTAYLDHIGMATFNASYGGRGDYAVYHSLYDTFDYYTRFLDGDFDYGVVEAQTMATALVRLADAPVLPFEFGRVVRTYRGYAEEIEEAAAAREGFEGLDLGAVFGALDRLEGASERLDDALVTYRGLPAGAVDERREALSEVSRELFLTERELTSEEGLRGREWFRHLIYAPGYYTGYGVKTMAGVREAVEDVPSAEVARREAARVAEALDAYAARVDRAASLLEEAVR